MNSTSQDRATLGAEAPGGEPSSLSGATPQVAAPPTRLTTAELAALYARQDKQRTAEREGQAQTADQSPSDTAAPDAPPESPAAGWMKISRKGVSLRMRPFATRCA